VLRRIASSASADATTTLMATTFSGVGFWTAPKPKAAIVSALAFSISAVVVGGTSSS